MFGTEEAKFEKLPAQLRKGCMYRPQKPSEAPTRHDATVVRFVFMGRTQAYNEIKKLGNCYTADTHVIESKQRSQNAFKVCF